jgi:Cys-rich protein (TIGR01571 family)
MQSNNSNNNNDESYTTHLPGQIAHPNQMTTGGGWSTGLCECSDIGTCCLGLTCPCILYGRTQYRLLRKSRGEDPTNMLGYETCNGSCTAMALFCGCQWILATIQHTRTRRAYRIEGGICSDCVRATCCPCCTCIRNEREIKLREDARAHSAQLNGANFVSPYLSPGQMQYRAG